MAGSLMLWYPWGTGAEWERGYQHWRGLVSRVRWKHPPGRVSKWRNRRAAHRYMQRQGARTAKSCGRIVRLR